MQGAVEVKGNGRYGKGKEWGRGTRRDENVESGREEKELVVEDVKEKAQNNEVIVVEAVKEGRKLRSRNKASEVEVKENSRR